MLVLWNTKIIYCMYLILSDAWATKIWVSIDGLNFNLDLLSLRFSRYPALIPRIHLVWQRRNSQKMTLFLDSFPGPIYIDDTTVPATSCSSAGWHFLHILMLRLTAANDFLCPIRAGFFSRIYFWKDFNEDVVFDTHYFALSFRKLRFRCRE